MVSRKKENKHHIYIPEWGDITQIAKHFFPEHYHAEIDDCNQSGVIRALVREKIQMIADEKSRTIEQMSHHRSENGTQELV